MNINGVTLQHNIEFIVFIFLFNGFVTCNLKNAFDTRGILSTPVSDVHERPKTSD